MLLNTLYPDALLALRQSSLTDAKKSRAALDMLEYRRPNRPVERGRYRRRQDAHRHRGIRPSRVSLQRYVRHQQEERRHVGAPPNPEP